MTKKEYQKQWRKKNKEQQRVWHKEYYQKNKETLLLKNKKYYKKWYQENKEEKDAKNKEYAQTHKAEMVKNVQRYVEKNKEKVTKYNSEYGKSLAGFWRRYKFSAKKRGYEIAITLKDFEEITAEPCNYCGDNERQRGIDRVDNNIGYLKENCVSCCGICNMMKMKLTKEDFLNHIKKIYKTNC